jgi:hypothetical protein
MNEPQTSGHPELDGEAERTLSPFTQQLEELSVKVGGSISCWSPCRGDSGTWRRLPSISTPWPNPCQSTSG